MEKAVSASAVMNAREAISVAEAGASSQTDTAAKKIADASTTRPRNTARRVRTRPGVCNCGRSAGSIFLLHAGAGCKLQGVANSVNRGWEHIDSMPMPHLAVLLQDAEAIGGGSIANRMLLVLVLVLINGFFVAAEFSLVAVRHSRIEEMVAAGDKRARTVQGALQDLDRYIAGTQLGITIASLGLGWVGEPAVAGILDSVLQAFGMTAPPAGVHTAASFIVGFLILTFLHIVLGELAPKSVALVRPESVSRLV